VPHKLNEFYTLMPPFVSQHDVQLGTKIDRGTLEEGPGPASVDDFDRLMFARPRRVPRYRNIFANSY
jgi:hypothetical protein